MIKENEQGKEPNKDPEAQEGQRIASCQGHVADSAQSKLEPQNKL